MSGETEAWRPDAEPWEALQEALLRAYGHLAYEDVGTVAETLSEMGWRLVPLVRLRELEAGAEPWVNEAAGFMSRAKEAEARVRELEAENKRLRDKYLPTIDDVRGILRTDRPAPEIKVGQPEVTERGFKHWPDIEATDALVKVYESSAAGRPHLWLRIEERGAEAEEAAAHLPLWEAQCLADTLYAAIRNHYQVEPSPPVPSLNPEGLAWLDAEIADLESGSGAMAWRGRRNETAREIALYAYKQARERLVSEEADSE